MRRRKAAAQNQSWKLKPVTGPFPGAGRFPRTDPFP